MSRNPIRCDCNLRWLVGFRNSTSLNLRGACHEPTNLNGVLLQALAEDQFLCRKCYCLSCNYGLKVLMILTGCTRPCIHGVCNVTVGSCDCNSGYRGTTCDASEQAFLPLLFCYSIANTIHHTLACPAGMYGVNCLEACNCRTVAVYWPPCNHMNGTCHCLPGYTGLSCENGTRCCTANFRIFSSLNCC